MPFAALIASRKLQLPAPLVSPVVLTVKLVARAGDAIVTASTAIIATSRLARRSAGRVFRSRRRSQQKQL